MVENIFYQTYPAVLMTVTLEHYIWLEYAASITDAVFLHCVVQHFLLSVGLIRNPLKKILSARPGMSRLRVYESKNY